MQDKRQFSATIRSAMNKFAAQKKQPKLLFLSLLFELMSGLFAYLLDDTQLRNCLCQF